MTDKPEGAYYYRMGMHLLEIGDMTGAIESFITSIALSPDELSFWFGASPISIQTSAIRPLRIIQKPSNLMIPPFQKSTSSGAHSMD